MCLNAPQGRKWPSKLALRHLNQRPTFSWVPQIAPPELKEESRGSRFRVATYFFRSLLGRLERIQQNCRACGRVTEAMLGRYSRRPHVASVKLGYQTSHDYCSRSSKTARPQIKRPPVKFDVDIAASTTATWWRPSFGTEKERRFDGRNAQGFM